MLESVIIEPHQTAKYSIVWLHGLGADGHDFESIVPELYLPPEMPVRFIFPHANKRSVTINNGMVMRAWYDILELSVNRRIDFDSIDQSTLAVLELIEAENDKGIPCQNIMIGGFSQGGVIALDLACMTDLKLAGVFGLSCYFPTAERFKDKPLKANQETPFFLAHGTFDPVISIDLGKQSKADLEEIGVKVQWETYPIQHAVNWDEITALSLFIQKCFSGKK